MIRQQFLKDCTVKFKAFDFTADLQTQLLMRQTGEVLDKDGFPVPVDGDDRMRLQSLLHETYSKAKQRYFERMATLVEH